MAPVHGRGARGAPCGPTRQEQRKEFQRGHILHPPPILANVSTARFTHSLPFAVQDLRKKTDRPQNLKLCRLRLNFKALRCSCLAADLVPEEDVCYTTPEDPRVNAVVSQFPGDQGSGARWVVTVLMMVRKCTSLHYRALRQWLERCLKMSLRAQLKF